MPFCSAMYKQDLRYLSSDFVDDFLDAKYRAKPVTKLPVKRVYINSGATPLHEAAAQGDMSTVIGLIKNKADLVVIDCEGYTPLHTALANKRSLVARLLVEHGAPVNVKNLKGQTPLYIASSNGDVESVRLLLKYRAAVDERAQELETFAEDITPLYVAAQMGHLQVVRQLIDKGANIHIKRQHGTTPILVAAQKGYLDIVMQLALQGADLSLQSEIARQSVADEIPYAIIEYMEFTAPIQVSRTIAVLEAAEHNSMKELIHALKEGGQVNENKADIHASRLPGGNSALHFAVLNGNIEMVKYLLAKGANVNAQNIDGDTPLHLAAKQGNQSIIFGLLINGSDPAIENYNRETVLHIALEHPASWNMFMHTLGVDTTKVAVPVKSSILNRLGVQLMRKINCVISPIRNKLNQELYIKTVDRKYRE